MANSLYITAIEAGSGKSIVALGILELLSRRIRKIGYFRPVIPSSERKDNNIELIRSRYDIGAEYEAQYGYTHDVARNLSADGQTRVVMKNILAKYKALEKRCRFVVCEGTDLTGVSSAFEFDFNADVAGNLSASILLVLNGKKKTPTAILELVRVAQRQFQDKGCTILATFVNRVDPDKVAAVRECARQESVRFADLYVLPEEPLLSKPVVGDIADALDAAVMQGEADGMGREVSNFKVAAMRLPHFLDRLENGDLIITPGDRADIIIGTLAAAASETHPNIAGLLLSGGLIPESQVQRIVKGLSRQLPLPVIHTEADTYATALKASMVRPELKPGNERKIAAALGLFEFHADLEKLEERIAVVRSSKMTPIMFEYMLIERAREPRQHIVLPEGEEERILQAAEILMRRGVAELTLLGDEEIIRRKIGKLGLDMQNVRVINPRLSNRKTAYAREYHDIRKHKGISEKMAMDTMTDVSYFGTMMVHRGDADGMVSGAVHTTGDTIRPAFQIIRTRPGVSVVSSVFLMCLADRVLVYGDCAVNPDPDAGQLADIAISSAQTAATYGIEPRIAMCSYSTGTSGKGSDVDKVREATRMVRERRPDLKVEGPIQYDAAVDAGVARTKLPDSEVAGKATVFIFPDLNTGNNLYKAVQRSAGAVAIGPVLQGLNKPVNDLSRGCTVADIVNTVAITAIQAGID